MTKTVFIAGAFDGCHAGHIHLLKEARKLGTELIVAINEDEDVKKRKGPDRPVYNQSVRSSSLLETGLVDNVFVFNGNLELLELIRGLQPDIIVTGDDYLEANVVGFPFYLSWGGIHKTIKKLPNISTTQLIKEGKL